MSEDGELVDGGESWFRDGDVPREQRSRRVDRLGGGQLNFGSRARERGEEVVQLQLHRLWGLFEWVNKRVIDYLYGRGPLVLGKREVFVRSRRRSSKSKSKSKSSVVEGSLRGGDLGEVCRAFSRVSRGKREEEE